MNGVTHLALLVLAATPAVAASLSEYTYSSRYSLANTSEASGVTYNWDTGTFFVVGDEGYSVDQYSRTGQYIDSMILEHNVSPREARAVDDAEGIAYVGNGRFMIADERDFMGRVTTYEPGVTRTLPQLEPTSFFFDPRFVYGGDNTGLEGVAYDPIDGGAMWGIKELNPVAVLKMTGQFTSPNGEVNVTEPIERRNITRWETNLGISQFSDIYALSACEAFSLDDPRRMNLLLLSRVDNMILEITRSGTVVDSLDLSFLGRTTIEGLTLDEFGNIVLVAEGGSTFASDLYVLQASSVPEPSVFVLTAAGMLGLCIFGRFRRKTAS